MTKIMRKIIQIDDLKCNGCGLCIPACPEGALQIIDGKARLIKEQFCDGLGACLGDCPEDALHVIEREVEVYDAEGVVDHIRHNAPDKLQEHFRHMDEHKADIEKASRPSAMHSHAACPGSKAMQWQEHDPSPSGLPRQQSQLRQWPVQLHLVPPGAPYFRNADIMIVADCVPFAYPNFHEEFVKDNAIAVGCPKLDDVEAYIMKIAQIIQQSKPKSLTVLYMEVPCCTGLVHITRQAIEQSGISVPLSAVLITIKGDKTEPIAVPIEAG
jgi:NAD-dependent dihydropyrimidine dehydrogenase PreA subunit